MPIESCSMCLMKVQKRLLCFLSGRPRLSGAETVGHMISSTYAQYSLRKRFWILRWMSFSFEMFVLERYASLWHGVFYLFGVVVLSLWRSMGGGLFLAAFRWGTYCFMPSSSLAVNHSHRESAEPALVSSARDSQPSLVCSRKASVSSAFILFQMGIRWGDCWTLSTLMRLSTSMTEWSDIPGGCLVVGHKCLIVR